MLGYRADCRHISHLHIEYLAQNLEEHISFIGIGELCLVCTCLPLFPYSTIGTTFHSESFLCLVELSGVANLDRLHLGCSSGVSSVTGVPTSLLGSLLESLLVSLCHSSSLLNESLFMLLRRWSSELNQVMVYMSRLSFLPWHCGSTNLKFCEFHVYADTRFESRT